MTSEVYGPPSSILHNMIRCFQSDCEVCCTLYELKHPTDRSLPPPPMAPGNATEDDGAALRAVRAFLLDDDVVCALDSDEEEPIRPFIRGLIFR